MKTSRRLVLLLAASVGLFLPVAAWATHGPPQHPGAVTSSPPTTSDFVAGLPNRIPVSDRTTGKLVGYLDKDSAFGPASVAADEARKRAGLPGPAVTDVNGKLVGYMIDGQGFVPLDRVAAVLETPSTMSPQEKAGYEAFLRESAKRHAVHP